MTIDETTPGATIRVVDPAAEIESQSLPLAARVESLQGLRIGIIDNSKHMAESFLEATKVLLEQRYKVSGFEYYRKFSASVPTPPEILDGMTRSCDAVIHGVAD